MAITESKLSIHRAQGFRAQRKSTKPPIQSLRRLFRFPQTAGKVLEDVEFSTDSGYHNISINFRDKTSLNLEIEASFTVEADYSDWKTGNQRIIRAWKPVESLKLNAGCFVPKRSLPGEKK